MAEKRTLRLTFNSPVILGFVMACFLVLLADYATGGASTLLFFSVYRSSLKDPCTYIRFFGHVLGHAGFEHFIGNMMVILLVGPLLEEKYGGALLLKVMLITAFAAGLIHFIFFPGVRLLGASSIAFAFILMSSITNLGAGEIPLTFILVAVMYIGEQVYGGIFADDNISYLTHIIGGMIGSWLGFRQRT